jgi:hypothetical protein
MAYFFINLRRNYQPIPLLSREQGSVLMSAFGVYAGQRAKEIYISDFAKAVANYKKDGVVNWVPTVITGSDFFDFNGSYDIAAASTSLERLLVQKSFPVTITSHVTIAFGTKGNVDPYIGGKKLSSLPADSKYRDKLQLVMSPASDFDVEKTLIAYRSEQLLLQKQAKDQKDAQEKANKEIQDAGIAAKKAQAAAAAKVAATLKKAPPKKNQPKKAKGTTKPGKKPLAKLKK